MTIVLNLSIYVFCLPTFYPFFTKSAINATYPNLELKLLHLTVILIDKTLELNHKGFINIFFIIYMWLLILFYTVSGNNHITTTVQYENTPIQIY